MHVPVGAVAWSLPQPWFSCELMGATAWVPSLSLGTALACTGQCCSLVKGNPQEPLFGLPPTYVFVPAGRYCRLVRTTALNPLLCVLQAPGLTYADGCCSLAQLLLADAMA